MPRPAPTILLAALTLACSGAEAETESTTTAATATTTGATTLGPSSGESTGGSSTQGTTTAAANDIDLALESLTWSPPDPQIGDPITFTVRVRNLGSAVAPAAAIAFEIDGAPAPELLAEVAALGPSGVTDIQATSTWIPTEAGSRTITAIIDPQGLLADADLDNNRRDEPLVITAPTGACRTVTAWSASEPFADDAHVSHPLPSFASGGWYYVHTKTHGGADDRRLYAAKPGPDGALGPWQQASADHGGGPHGFTAVDVDGDAYHFRNGHIARYVLSDGVMQGDVVLVEDDVETAFGGNKYVWDSAVYAQLSGGQRWLIHLGGFSFAGYQYRPDVYRSAVPVQPAFTDAAFDHPSQRPGRAAFYGPSAAAHGYLYTGEGDGPRLWRATVNADGSFADPGDPWQQQADLPSGSGNQRGELFVAGATLFTVRGARVFRADLNEGGELSAWIELPTLPEDQVDINWGDGHLEGAANGQIGAHIYLTGPKRVFFARLEPAVCAT